MKHNLDSLLRPYALARSMAVRRKSSKGMGGWIKAFVKAALVVTLFILCAISMGWLSMHFFVWIYNYWPMPVTIYGVGVY